MPEAATLTGREAQDVDMTVRVRSDKAAVGDYRDFSLTARRTFGRTEYRARFQFCLPDKFGHRL